MSFDWAAYYELAQELVADAEQTDVCTEAMLRSAISRAYYAAFCSARNHLRDVEQKRIPKGAYTHVFVSSQFRKNGDRTHRDVGVNLDRLRLIRNKADYDDSLASLGALAQKALRRAERIISTLQDLP